VGLRELCEVVGDLVVEFTLNGLTPQQRADAQSKRMGPSGEFHRSNLLERDDERDSVRETGPVGGLPFEMTVTGTSERVEFRTPVVIRGSPLRRDPPALLKLVQCRIQGPITHLEDLGRHLSEALAE
jgi:hypothetical protein